MRHETQVELVGRALEKIEQRQSDADGVPFELTVDRYVDPEVLERERVLFREHPVVVGFSSQVSAPGDFITHAQSDRPILVTRDRDGALHAFLNVCRHRGTLLMEAPCGRVDRSLVCTYHGWTYGLSGRLEGVPHRSEFVGVDLEERGLVELPVAERFGLVFVNMTPGRSADPETHFRPFTQDLEGFGLADHVLYAPSQRTRRMNWKLMLDGSWEAYHFRTTHEKTIAPLFFDNIGVFDWQEPNLRMVLPKRTMVELGEQPKAEWRIRPHANLLYGLFPNTIILVQPDHAMIVTIWPESPDRSTIVAGMLIPEVPGSDRAEAHWKRNEEIFWSAIEEDIQMGERIQSTLTSGANTGLLFGRCEHLVGKYHRAIEHAMGGGSFT